MTTSRPGRAAIFAHSLPTGTDTSRWEPLSEHLRGVGNRAAKCAEAFGARRIALAAGLLHDIGKCALAYQQYIRGTQGRGPDHSTAGARAAVAEYGEMGRLLAFAIAGHHSGLMDAIGDGGSGRTLEQRLDPKGYAIPAYDGWRDHVSGLPSVADLRPDRRPLGHPDYPGFERSFLIRMIFSCLVDADFLETEGFYARAEGLEPPARGGSVTAAHRGRIRAHMATRRRDDTPLNRLRSEVLDHAVAKASLPPGLFTLTVPTGGGKTLTSLSFALDHALTHGLRRIVYVIPFTSIIEQTAKVFREALEDDGAILEHHASFDWDGDVAADGDTEGEGAGGLAKLRRDAENWDAPIVVTTAVQFFESLFAARTSRARKLHNLARAVIVLDEVQTLPVKLLRPCMAALDELARNYGATVVLCTATQPALRRIDDALPKRSDNGPACGFDIGEDRELAPRPRQLYATLKRAEIEWRREPVDDARIAARFGERERMLCIVNTRAHARDLFGSIASLPGARHLSTLMCARHRRAVLDQVRCDLKEGRPVRLVSTSLIEAGVDIDFPEVWRAAAGLDSIIQAAGRCNREGELEGFGRTVVFEPATAKSPPALDAFYQAARQVLRRDGDPLDLDAVHQYFRELYFEKGYAALDAAGQGKERYAIMAAIERTSQRFDFPFRRIAEAFRMIDDVMEPVLVDWNGKAGDALEALEHAPVIPGGITRRLQQYVVPVPKRVRAKLIAVGAARSIRSDTFGERFVRLTSDDLYREDTGLDWEDPTFREAERNIV